MKTNKLIILSSFFVLNVMLVSQTSFASDKIIEETQTHNIFKGALLSIWSKFKSFNPHNNQVAKSKTVYTAGIRGAESTGTLLQPYWKDDLTNDPKFKQELAEYGKALAHLDKGDLSKANDTLNQFITSFPKSSLKPNALFAQGMSFAGLGKKDNATQVLQSFVSDFPNHPLANDAKIVINEIK